MIKLIVMERKYLKILNGAAHPSGNVRFPEEIELVVDAEPKELDCLDQEW